MNSIQDFSSESNDDQHQNYESNFLKLFDDKKTDEIHKIHKGSSKDAKSEQASINANQF
jgi:hypothetical protein